MPTPPFRISFPEDTAITWELPKSRRGVRPKCKVSGCTSKVYARKMCSLHYDRLRHSGDSTIKRRKAAPKPSQGCVVNGCGDKCRAMNLCHSHYLEAFILARDSGISLESSKRKLTTVEPVRMDTGELRIDFIKKRAAALKKQRAKERKRDLQKIRREAQKYNYLADQVNEDDTDWGDNHE